MHYQHAFFSCGDLKSEREQLYEFKIYEWLPERRVINTTEFQTELNMTPCHEIFNLCIQIP